MKRSVKSALLSTLFMGLGQLYNGQRIKGAILIALKAFLLIFTIPYFHYSFWGLITLGESPQQILPDGRAIGDHSIFLLVQGLIALLIFLIIIAIYMLNIRDAYKNGILIEKGIKPPDFKHTIKGILEKGFPYLMITPATLFIVFLSLLPLLFGMAIAFTNYSSPNNIPPRNLVNWVGFRNFINIFKMNIWNETLLGVGAWTVIWATLSTLTSFIAGLMFAVFLNSKNIRLKKFWRSIFILPYAMPAMISLLIMRNLFNGQFGPINQFLVNIGMERIPWLTNATLAKATIILVNIWLGFPYFMALTSGIMSNISKDVYEAAQIDGANSYHEFTKITLPLVLYSVSPLLIMSFAHNFNNFGVIYFLTEGGPVNASFRYAGSSDILITWLYNMTYNHNQFHMASVISIMIFLVLAPILIWNFTRTKSFKEEDMIQ